MRIGDVNNKYNGKILLVYAGKTTTADIVIRLMQKFARRNEIEVKAVENIYVRKHDIEWASCVLVIRGADFFLSKIIETAKKAGKFCVFYIDDDLLSVYGKNNIYGKYIKKCVWNSLGGRKVTKFLAAN